ncbi:TRAP transporter small permease [Agrobacterium sp. 22-221-1]|uniref:TRAP transporter small permease n=1 Tax=Agrobacterium leguminum TaxID=2792015 RepID=UPI003CE45D06
MATDNSQPFDHSPPWFAALRAVSTGLNRIGATIAAVILVGMVLLILTEVGLRFFSRSTYMTDVLVGYGLAAATMLSMAWATEKSSMIRVTIVRRNVSRRGKWILDFFSVLFTIFMSGLLVFYGYRSMLRNFIGGRLSEHFIPIPLWIPDVIFLSGFALLIFHLLVRLIELFTDGVSEESDLEL